MRVASLAGRNVLLAGDCAIGIHNACGGLCGLGPKALHDTEHAAAAQIGAFGRAP
jgi:hypothetical protein